MSLGFEGEGLRGCDFLVLPLSEVLEVLLRDHQLIELISHITLIIPEDLQQLLGCGVDLLVESLQQVFLARSELREHHVDELGDLVLGDPVEFGDLGEVEEWVQLLANRGGEVEL